MEDDAVGIELTPFTNKDITVGGEDEEQKSIQIHVQDEGSHDTLDDMSHLTTTGREKQPKEVSK